MNNEMVNKPDLVLIIAVFFAALFYVNGRAANLAPVQLQIPQALTTVPGSLSSAPVPAYAAKSAASPAHPVGIAILAKAAKAAPEAAPVIFIPMVSSGRAPAGNTPTLAGCPTFPADNIWNARVDALPVDAHSTDYINSIGASSGLHPDFGSGEWNGGPIGIPFNIVPGSQPKAAMTFEYASESDPGPYPIPPDALIEGGPTSTGDRHILTLDKDQCKLYETWNTYSQGSGWHAGSGAVFDLRSNALRPATWTSADAAGLPILPGLVRYDEVASGAIRHAIRFTVVHSRRAYVWPARHYASSNTSLSVPPLGQRFRLKSTVELANFPPEVRPIFQAFKTYGLILADNGSNWYVSGAPDERWNNDLLNRQFGLLHGSDFEAVDSSSLMVTSDSGQVH